MKVYVVHGCLLTGVESDSTIYGVFDNREKAIDYAISIGRKALDEISVPAESRECVEMEDSENVSYNGEIFCLMDKDNFDVYLCVSENEVQ